MTTMSRTTTALLALAAFAGVAIAADDSNIGSRHAVDVKKVRISKKNAEVLYSWQMLLPWCTRTTRDMCFLFNVSTAQKV